MLELIGQTTEAKPFSVASMKKQEPAHQWRAGSTQWPRSCRQGRHLEPKVQGGRVVEGFERI